MRVIFAGGGEIGFALANALSAQHDVFVVDQAPEIADRFEPLDVQLVLGTGTSSEVLTRAGVDRADVSSPAQAWTSRPGVRLVQQWEEVVHSGRSSDL